MSCKTRSYPLGMEISSLLLSVDKVPVDPCLVDPVKFSLVTE